MRDLKEIDKEMRALFPQKELAYADYRDNTGSSIAGNLWDDFVQYRDRWNLLVDEYEALKNKK